MGEKISEVGLRMKLGFSSLGCAIAIRGVFEFVYSNICDDTVISISFLGFCLLEWFKIKNTKFKCFKVVEGMSYSK